MEQPFAASVLWSPVAHARPFPALSSEHMQLLVDPQSHAILLLHLDEEQRVSLLRSISLSSSAARIFGVLWRAYPDPCSYHDLFLALYPLPENDEERTWQQDLVLRPIRRAVMALAPALRELGLAVVSLRGRGYLLASAHSSGETACHFPRERAKSIQ